MLAQHLTLAAKTYPEQTGSCNGTQKTEEFCINSTPHHSLREDTAARKTSIMTQKETPTPYGHSQALSRKRIRRGKTTEWYVRQPFNHTVWGHSGLAAKDWLLLVSDQEGGGLVRFDLRKKRGIPKQIPLTPQFKLTYPDAAHLLRKYKGTFLLVAQVFNGTAVFESKSGKWDKAEYKGTVPIPDESLVSTAVTQVGSSIYMVTQPPMGGYPLVPGTLAGNLSDFRFPDITGQVDALLNA
jgi:hypothetical protein